MRKQLAELALFVKKGKPSRSLEEFDSESERLIAESLGETSFAEVMGLIEQKG